mgnify:CR=1 FL=1
MPFHTRVNSRLKSIEYDTSITRAKTNLEKRINSYKPLYQEQTTPKLSSAKSVPPKSGLKSELRIKAIRKRSSVSQRHWRQPKSQPLIENFDENAFTLSVLEVVTKAQSPTRSCQHTRSRNCRLCHEKQSADEFSYHGEVTVQKTSGKPKSLIKSDKGRSRTELVVQLPHIDRSRISSAAKSVK